VRQRFWVQDHFRNVAHHLRAGVYESSASEEGKELFRGNGKGKLLRISGKTGYGVRWNLSFFLSLFFAFYGKSPVRCSLVFP
jgi:hypothetical protein